LNDAEHCDLLKVFLGMTCAAGDIAGHGGGNISML
jgi:hypothetical protein